MGDVSVQSESEVDKKSRYQQIGKFLYCFLKTAFLIADNIFDNYVNDSIFSDILQRKILFIERELNQGTMKTQKWL